jgi:hypothetical protein
MPPCLLLLFIIKDREFESVAFQEAREKRVRSTLKKRLRSEFFGSM